MGRFTTTHPGARCRILGLAMRRDGAGGLRLHAAAYKNHVAAGKTFRRPARSRRPLARRPASLRAEPARHSMSGCRTLAAKNGRYFLAGLGLVARR